MLHKFISTAIQTSVDLELENLSDKEQWELVKSSSEVVFQHLYETYFDGLYFYGMYIAQDEERVKDAVQDLFVRLWINRAKIDIQHSLKFYFFSALRKNLLKQLKRDATKIDISTLDHLPQSSDFMDSWLIEEKNNSLALYLKKHIDQLSPRHREIIHLKFFEGLSYKEISQLTGLDQQYLYNIINKVSGILKAKIDRKKLSEL